MYIADIFGLSQVVLYAIQYISCTIYSTSVLFMFQQYGGKCLWVSVIFQLMRDVHQRQAHCPLEADDTFRNIQHTCHMTSVTNSNRHVRFEHIGNNGGRKHTYIIYTSKYCQFMIMDFLKNRTPSQCFGYKSASAAVLTKNILLFSYKHRVD